MQSERRRGREEEMSKSSKPEILTAKPQPTVCQECKSEDVECCEVTLDKTYKVYYTQCRKCHEVDVFKIDKKQSE
jgi:hypothetical protein